MSARDELLVRPFFGYYGGKWRWAKTYPSPAHDTIVEPFAGSAGYALRHAGRKVILCDLDPHVVGVWRYLTSVSAEEVLRLPDVAPHGCVDDLDHLPQEARWLIGFWLNRGGSRPKKRPSKWMREGVRPGSFWGSSVRERIARQVDLIRHWEVRHCSYAELTPVIATWFVDPPYEVAGRHYRHGSSGIDYSHLGGWCRSLPGQAIVCEQAGATWLPFLEHGNRKTTRAGKRSNEVIWEGGCNE